MARRPRSGRRYRDAGKRRLGGQPFRRRHRRLITGVTTVLVLLMGSVAGYAYHLNAQLNQFGRVDISAVGDGDVDPDEGRALNILLLGSDQGEGSEGGDSIEEDAAAASWPSGKYRSDTLMVVHIPRDRSAVHLVSIPRDTYTDILDEDGEVQSREKINAAFSTYGPRGAVNTVEALTGLSIDHLAIIDWAGFKDITTAVGGVEVFIPNTFYDPSQKIRWEAGDQVLEGERALQYVRTRYGLLRGDFDRIARQQNFMRSVMNKMLSRGVLANPVSLANTLGALADNMTLDSGWSTGNLRNLALSLRGVGSGTVNFLTAPVATTEELAGVGSIVRLDEARATELWQAIASDTIQTYLDAYPDEELGSDREIA
ncbi:cell envelope-like function transcriptional attenuator common domain protein [Aeromicrobium marinum DSM 15272]|uniref:Cell envelope-like function transcriptional attenuator common domain protein n=1 Tax=Aeromicrobium marinum DSM 15272 TaxID=585531 RepID=E2SBQ7_9ACTN|nr:LCP family protein [Aeromicrobium marinum]EFQ83193.1 cell envelope-like function transcriptional attenuator common domain protein [Aeromicrobium marinum DSM 15272]